ncbi:unnamed protein product [Urochloa decumbens]|uniref:Cytochrome P450 n=1 Tax=Urochloa decumbens TaxID=240449 RepID=A0ABC9AXB1_9POAL
MEDNKVLLATLSVLVLLVVLSKLMKSLVVPQPKLNLPPGPWTLPVMGSLHHLDSSRSTHRVMRDLAQKHGPLMMLRLGTLPALVVSSAEAAQEVMKTQDLAFADRFVSTNVRTLSSDSDGIVFMPYGDRWRQLRKIAVLELLTAGRVLSFRHIREDEVSRLMGSLAASAGAGAAVNLSKMISRYVNDTFIRESVGSRCKYQDEYLDALHSSLRHTLAMTVADLFPSSRLMQMLGTASRQVLMCRDRLQGVLEKIIHDAKEAVDRGDDASEGFVGVMLRLQKERSAPVEMTDETIAGVLLVLFTAGSETSSSTLNWCMTELVRWPAVMAKAQAEVREAFKGKTTITEIDLEGLSYLKLVIKEALRMHPPAPLLVPRQCRETCQVMGYDVPKGTVVYVNVWAISRDPKYWDDPEEFKPERFEDSNLDYKGTNYEYLPFGAGRRICPGINLGVGNIELALANLLYHFDWKLPDGVEPKDIDLSEAEGLAVCKKIDMVLHPITRVPPAVP